MERISISSSLNYCIEVKILSVESTDLTWVGKTASHILYCGYRRVLWRHLAASTAEHFRTSYQKDVFPQRPTLIWFSLHILDQSIDLSTLARSWPLAKKFCPERGNSSQQPVPLYSLSSIRFDSAINTHSMNSIQNHKRFLSNCFPPNHPRKKPY